LIDVFFVTHINKFVKQNNLSKMSKKKYLGYKEEDFKQPYAKFFNEEVQPMPPDVALKKRKLSPSAIDSLQKIAQNLMQDGYLENEIGYTIEPNGEQRISVITKMPNVNPKMWDWWFGWHGCSDSRYKLWHPKAHVSAVWQDGKNDIAYIDRVSMIQEYIGTTLEKANIQFFNPEKLGFSKTYLADNEKVVAICARLGLTSFPLDFGYLVHQIRATNYGAEMRSRFFIGGEHIALRADNFITNGLSAILSKLYQLPEQQAIDLLTHCSEEMNHIATFLPSIYKENH
jgi:hypothetical protein